MSDTRPTIVPPKQSVTSANALQVLGVVVLAIGLGFVTLWAGLVAFGIGLIGLGVLMELD